MIISNFIIGSSLLFIGLGKPSMFPWNAANRVPPSDYSYQNLQNKLSGFDASQQSIEGKEREKIKKNS